jgi:hypothetical protein
MIALRHQIAVLERSRTRRPCFGLWDRLFWILLSWRWPRWPESLMIHSAGDGQARAPQGWSGLWRYRPGGRWRGGRPRVSREVRELINQWLGRTSLGVHRESTASCSCLGSRFTRRPYPATWRPCTEVPGNRGGRLFAIRRSPSDTGTILSTPTKTGRAARNARIVAI